jgi:hypothetical protein
MNRMTIAATAAAFLWSAPAAAKGCGIWSYIPFWGCADEVPVLIRSRPSGATVYNGSAKLPVVTDDSVYVLPEALGQIVLRSGGRSMRLSKCRKTSADEGLTFDCDMTR